MVNTAWLPADHRHLSLQTVGLCLSLLSGSSWKYQGKLTYPKTLKCWFSVHWGQSYFSGEGASLTLVCHSSGDDVTIKIPYG